MEPQEDWRPHAACLGVETELFFPISILKSNKRQIEELFDLCSQCSVSTECLKEAFDTNSIGIWAKTTYIQREHYLEFRQSDEEVTFEECKELFEYIDTNDIYPYTRKYKEYIDSFVNSNE